MKNSPRMKKNTWWSRQVSSNGTCKRSWSLWSLCSWSQVKRLKTYCQFSEEEKAYWIAISSMKAMSIVGNYHCHFNQSKSQFHNFFSELLLHTKNNHKRTTKRSKKFKSRDAEIMQECPRIRKGFHLKKRNLRVFSNEQKVRSKSCLAQNAKVRFPFTWRGLNE